jgi:hypothetical protein
LDNRVLEFLSLIAPRITASEVQIHFHEQMSDLDEKQRSSVNQLLQLFRENITPTTDIHFNGNLSSLRFVADVDNKMNKMDCWGVVESDIPILMDLLASPRPDGQQRVMEFYFQREQRSMAPILLDAIKEV